MSVRNNPDLPEGMKHPYDEPAEDDEALEELLSQPIIIRTRTVSRDQIEAEVAAKREAMQQAEPWNRQPSPPALTEGQWLTLGYHWNITHLPTEDEPWRAHMAFSPVRRFITVAEMAAYIESVVPEEVPRG